MKKIRLAKTTLDVSQLCLGTNQFGTMTATAQAAEILEVFTALGGNFIDTAHSYGDWIPSASRAASEHVLGQWLRQQRRADYVIATKGCEFDYRAGDYALRVTPALLEQDLLGSLAALQIDCIDLYWLHRDDASRPVEIIIDALIGHQQAGRIRYFGCSNWSVARIQEAQQYAKSIGHDGFVACQPLWGLAVPARDAMLKYCPGG
ncbi:MAG TPA: aldo/keto reductase, partial [Spongiibacteraceae bacterium]|nr:aldo/keto reductase [Spongiibacteraceae bacterium]